MIGTFIKNYSKIIHQFGRYLIVGGIAFIFDFSTLLLLTEFLSVPYLTSAAIAFIVGLNINYFLGKFFVFKESKIGNLKQEYLLVGIISFIGLLLNQFLIWGFTEVFGVFYLVSKLFSTAIILVYNFGIRKIFIFH